jgi:hypothetical protein
MKQEQEWAQPSPVLRLYYPKRTIFGLIVVPTVLNCAPFGLGGVMQSLRVSTCSSLVVYSVEFSS